ncbi:glycosyltransferase [uncultured Treponema sp.]|jgi:Glycosyltransferase|uniref:glycosyltransferase n=1 Tax=uncultured Treponema sp. TaxID=162155 RepID=UPI0028E922EA|nr:glycosyltransferase [uncultured Treponema sp.]
MKILHIITNTELGGAQSVCIFLANAAAQDGHTVAVASMPGGYLWGQLHHDVLQFTIKTMVKPISLLADMRCYFELKKVIMQFCPDVIHLHSSKAGALGRLAGIRYRDRIIYTVHGFDSIRLRHKVFLPLERFLQRYCFSIVSVSQYDEINLKNAKINNNIITIHNGITLPKPVNTKPFDDSEYKRVVMTIARIAPPKRFEGFLAVASHQAMQHVLFVWVGGSTDKTLAELQQEYTIPHNVVLLGDYAGASSLLVYCDLFMLLSDYEGMPMTILEAMSQRKAIVASNVGGIPELVDDSNGILVKTDEDAVIALQQLVNDDEKLKKMGQVSFHKYIQNFTFEQMYNKYYALYETIANIKRNAK